MGMKADAINQAAAANPAAPATEDRSLSTAAAETALDLAPLLAALERSNELLARIAAAVETPAARPSPLVVY